MGIVRNFIEVAGITSEDELPDRSYGQLVKYSEVENIAVPREKPGIKEIYQIGINIEIKSKRTINTADSKTMVLDGTKTLKIVCTQFDDPDKVIMLNLSLPYNTFIEVPCQVKNVENIYIHVLDAYFEVLDKRKIYSHFVYLVDVRYSSMDLVLPASKADSGSIGQSQIALSQEEQNLTAEKCRLWERESKHGAVACCMDIDCEYL